MSDIVERLRMNARQVDFEPGETDALVLEAADEIERLATENERLRVALLKIKADACTYCFDVARRALEGK